ncbi:MAG: hypothetical protein DCC68_10245 [Planctomycetota bacterium]|nr:MAG: hypothetical protein DCC68_10245 [Planctomycetota bacterium]
MTPKIDVVASGSPRAMGYAQGEALRDRIAGSRRMLAELEAFRLLQPRWLPYPLFLRSAQRRARAALEAAVHRDAPESAARLAGIAAGSRMRLDALYLLNGLEAFMCSLSGNLAQAARMEAAASVASACSAVAVRGCRTRDGNTIVARNFDYLPLVQPFYILRQCRPDNGFRSIEFTAAPLAGAIDGINEHGLCIAYNYAYAMDPGLAAATISMAISAALAHCATVDEAATLIANHRRNGAGLLMLADAEGDIASVELSSNHTAIRRASAGEDVLCHSNSYATAAMQQIEAPPNAYYSQRVPKPLRGRRVLESSDRRDDRFAELLAQTGQFDADNLQTLMSDHGPHNQPSACTPCMHSDYWNTTACVQFYPKERRMRIAYDSACRARFVGFAL